MRLQLEAIERGWIVAGGDHHPAGRPPGLDRVGNRRGGRRLVRQHDLIPVCREDLGGAPAELIGEKAAIVADDDRAPGAWDRVGLPVIRGGLGDAFQVGEGEILRDDRAPAVGAELDLTHAMPGVVGSEPRDLGLVVPARGK